MVTDCIKGKQTKYTKKGATSGTHLPEIMYTNDRQFGVSSIGGGKKYLSPLSMILHVMIILIY